MDPVQKSVKSKDGTVIAYEQSGRGPAVILVAHLWPTGQTPSDPRC